MSRTTSLVCGHVINFFWRQKLSVVIFLRTYRYVGGINKKKPRTCKSWTPISLQNSLSPKFVKISMHKKATGFEIGFIRCWKIINHTIHLSVSWSYPCNNFYIVMIKFFLVFNMHFLTFFLFWALFSSVFYCQEWKPLWFLRSESHVLSYYIFHDIFINSVSAEFEKIKG